jgi:hypothetical protein
VLIELLLLIHSHLTRSSSSISFSFTHTSFNHRNGFCRPALNSHV